MVRTAGLPYDIVILHMCNSTVNAKGCSMDLTREEREQVDRALVTVARNANVTSLAQLDRLHRDAVIMAFGRRGIKVWARYRREQNGSSSARLASRKAGRRAKAIQREAAGEGLGQRPMTVAQAQRIICVLDREDRLRARTTRNGPSVPS